MAKIIITVSGKKDAGKTTIANQIAASYLNLRGWATHGGRYTVNSNGKLILKLPTGDEVTDCVEHGLSHPMHTAAHGIRIIAFASPLKDFCIKVLGLTHEQCYGTNAQKDAPTHIRWDGLPFRTRWKYRRKWWHRPRHGRMSGRNVMQVFGTDLIRLWYADAWARAGYELAVSIPEEVVVINDGRFPNEVTVGKSYHLPHGARPFGEGERHVITVRLLRNLHPEDRHPSETAMDSFPLTYFDLVVPKHVDLEEQGQLIERYLITWLGSAGMIAKKAA